MTNKRSQIAKDQLTLDLVTAMIQMQPARTLGAAYGQYAAVCHLSFIIGHC
jgi:hypothetical protein